MMRPALVLAASVVTFASLVSGQIQAATRVATSASNAVGACQPALPTFDGNIRKRLLARQPESSAAAFLTCAFPADGSASSAVRAFMYPDNNTSSAVTIRCTLVQGISGAPRGANITKSVAMSANSKLNVVLWDGHDKGGTAIGSIASTSCSLPVGTGISYVAMQVNVEIGT